MYVRVRDQLERHAVANRENVWNGRPISLIVPAEPLEVLDGKQVPLIELIPPVHQRVYKMGLEHLGVVVGDAFDAFVGAHKPVLTGQQFQGPNSTPDPVCILFEDFTHVKFYRLSLRASVELDTGPFDDGFHHVDELGAPPARDRDRPEPSAALSDAWARHGCSPLCGERSRRACSLTCTTLLDGRDVPLIDRSPDGQRACEGVMGWGSTPGVRAGRCHEYCRRGP